MPFDGRELNQTAAHLLRARQYIIDFGWCEEGPQNDVGAVCMVSAIARTSKTTRGAPAGWWLGVAIGVEPSFTDGYHIGKWNDAEGRTLEQVLDAFDRAVVLAVTNADT